ncbi:MAG: hydrogenase maturation protease [Acidimicrobiales bacterium]|nr:hydrogenase maturation protease [Acidimicrobiales bacterium]
MNLVIGCGNLLRGDDAVGPVLVRRLLDRGLPDGCEVADGGTSGMDVAFRMRGADRVILVDACTTGNEPGSIFRMLGSDVEELPDLATLNLHSFRWDHALAFARWLLKDEYPTDVVVYLVEAGGLEFGAPLTPAADAATDRVVDMLLTGELDPERV